MTRYLLISVIASVVVALAMLVTTLWEFRRSRCVPKPPAVRPDDVVFLALSHNGTMRIWAKDGADSPWRLQERDKAGSPFSAPGDTA